MLSIDERVAATLRNPTILKDLQKRYPPEQLLVLSLGVTSQMQITEAFEATKRHFRRLDVVVNNAGYVLVGEVGNDWRSKTSCTSVDKDCWKDPPLRLQLGTNAFVGVRNRANKTAADAEKWETLSHSTNRDAVDAAALAKVISLQCQD